MHKSCVFPFQYKGITYHKCTSIEDEENGQPWCSTEVDSNGIYIEGLWGYCNTECFEGNSSLVV